MLFAPALFAQDTPRQDEPLRAPRASAPALSTVSPNNGAPGRLKTTPNFASVYQPRLLEYPTSADLPNYSAYFDGNGVALTNSTFPRNKYAIGIQTNGMDGGGCVALDLTHPYSSCLMLPDANGNPVQASVAREVWTFRISYVDPTNPSAAEVNIGFVGGFGGDDTIEWVRSTAGGHRCFTLYPCDYYGLDLDYLTGTAAWSLPSCTMKLGAGYHAYIFYQSSPYDEGHVPAGALEWYPVTTAATATRLAQPGGIIFSRSYSLGRSDNALGISVSGLVHPEVSTNTGYPTVAPTIPPGSATVTVTAYDCGAIPNLAFTIDRQFALAGGHVGHGTTPSLDDVSSMDAYSGTTGANGRWTTTLHAGEIASAMEYTPSAANLEGSPFTGHPVTVTTGFVSLIDPGPTTGLRYTGQTATHPNNHNGSVELHFFVRDLATNYNNDADPGDQGSFGLNDMSLPLGGVFDIQAGWSPPHSRHRFGTDCDIDRYAQRPDGTLALIDTRLLRRKVRGLNGILLIESGGRLHVQVPEYTVATILQRETR